MRVGYIICLGVWLCSAPVAIEGQSADPAAAQTPSGGMTQGPESRDRQEGIALAEGRLVYVKSGTAQRVVEKIQLSEGITVQPDGKIWLKDGREVFLQNGQILLLNGQVVDADAEVLDAVSSAEDRRPRDRRFTDARKDESAAEREENQ